MKGKKTLIVLQQPASRPQTDIPLHSPLHPPPTFDIFFPGAATPFPTNSTNDAKKQRPKAAQNKGAPQSSSAAKNQNTNLSTPEPRPGVNTWSQAGSKCHSSEMDLPENSQKEQNKRPPTINKDARPPLAEKSKASDTSKLDSNLPDYPSERYI